MESGNVQYIIFLVLTPVAVAVLAVAIVMTARRPLSRQSIPLIEALASSMGFLLTNSLELICPTEQGTFFFAQLSYLFSVPIPVFVFIFSLAFDERDGWLRGKWYAVLFVLPLATTVLAFTEPSHHLIWATVSYVPAAGMLAMKVTYGWFFWVSFAYAMALMAASGLLVLDAYAHAPRVYRRQLLLVLAGICTPLLLHLIYTLKMIPGFTKNFSPVAYAVTAVCIAAGLRRYKFLDLIPVGRSLLLEEMTDGMILVDPLGRIVDINPAAVKVLGLAEGAVGSDIDRVPDLAALIAFGAADGCRQEICMRGREGERYYDARVSRITNRRRVLIGSMVLLRDVTEAHKVLAEKTRLLNELVQASSEIRSLQQIIPICMFCKKVRDDDGFWHQVENYVSTHSALQFSHGLCPECERKHKELFPLSPDAAR